MAWQLPVICVEGEGSTLVSCSELAPLSYLLWAGKDSQAHFEAQQVTGFCVVVSLFLSFSTNQHQQHYRFSPSRAFPPFASTNACFLQIWHDCKFLPLALLCCRLRQPEAYFQEKGCPEVCLEGVHLPGRTLSLRRHY